MIAFPLAIIFAAAAPAEQTINLVLCPPRTQPQPAACLEKPSKSPFPPIDVPYQAGHAFAVYNRCVLDRFAIAMHSVRSEDEARQAHFASVEACRDVRSAQLARALANVKDRRNYGSRAAAQAAARLAFDRFDREFYIERASPPQSAAGSANREPSH